MKKFIALALTLAMMVSCLVLTASAASGVEVSLQGPVSIQAGDTFQVKVRVTDPGNLVGGVQGVVNVTGAEIVQVRANPELLTWNKTADVNTLYKAENNDITFAALNSLEASSYDTRIWFIIDYQATDDAVSVVLDGVKVSDKSANLIADAICTDIDSIAVTTPDPAAPSLTIDNAALLVARASGGQYTAANTANQSGLVINATFDMADADIDEFGVIFYPTSLLGDDILTVDYEGAVVAKVGKDHGLYTAVKNGTDDGAFAAALKFKFNTDEQALRFLGTKVTARAYYKIGETVVYASNSPADTYVKNGVANKAVLNIVIDKGPAIEDYNGEVSKTEFDEALNGLNTNAANWQVNRAKALKYVVDYAYSLEY